MEKEELLTVFPPAVWGTGETLGSWRAWHGLHGLNVPCRGEGTITVFLHRATSWAVTKMSEACLSIGWQMTSAVQPSAWHTCLLLHFSGNRFIFNQIAISDPCCFLYIFSFFFFNSNIYPVVWNINLTHDHVNGESRSSVTVRNKISLRTLKV